MLGCCLCVSLVLFYTDVAAAVAAIKHKQLQLSRYCARLVPVQLVQSRGQSGRSDAAWRWSKVAEALQQPVTGSTIGRWARWAENTHAKLVKKLLDPAELAAVVAGTSSDSEDL